MPPQARRSSARKAARAASAAPRPSAKPSGPAVSTQLVGWVATGIGAIGLILSLAANPLGIGSNPLEFGWLQTLGAVLACLMIAGGLWLVIRED